MTSTSFNVGLGDDTRSSSRVLRPPGGGHTDIFGGEPEPPRTTGRRMVPNATAAGGQIEGPGSHLQNQNGVSNGQEAKPEKPAEEPKAAAPAPHVAASAPQVAASVPQAEPQKRVRVPPGGFSSGLW